MEICEDFKSLQKKNCKVSSKVLPYLMSKKLSQSSDQNHSFTQESVEDKHVDTQFTTASCNSSSIVNGISSNFNLLRLSPKLVNFFKV